MPSSILVWATYVVLVAKRLDADWGYHDDQKVLFQRQNGDISSSHFEARDRKAGEGRETYDDAVGEAREDQPWCG